MAERPVSSTCSSQVRQAHNANHTKTLPTNQSSLLPWSACCVECFLVRCLLCPLALLGEALGSKSRPLVWRWSGKACTQLARAGVHRQRRRERERQRDRQGQRDRDRGGDRDRGRRAGRWAGGGWQSAKSGVRRTPMQPFMEKACQARLLEEAACSTKGRKAKCHIGCFAWRSGVPKGLISSLTEDL